LRQVHNAASPLYTRGRPLELCGSRPPPLGQCSTRPREILAREPRTRKRVTRVLEGGGAAPPAGLRHCVTCKGETAKRAKVFGGPERASGPGACGSAAQHYAATRPWEGRTLPCGDHRPPPAAAASTTALPRANPCGSGPYGSPKWRACARGAPVAPEPPTAARSGRRRGRRPQQRARGDLQRIDVLIRVDPTSLGQRLRAARSRFPASARPFLARSTPLLRSFHAAPYSLKVCPSLQGPAPP
jgi:hypothetical protein